MYAVIITGSGNITLLHTMASFSPGYTANGISKMRRLLLGTYGRLIQAQPISVCNELENNVTNYVVLVERYGVDSSCPYEQQAWLVSLALLYNE